MSNNKQLLTSKFKAKRVNIAARHRIDFNVIRVFPLLCPVREFDWIEKWDCEIIYCQSGVAELGCIFSTFNQTDGGKDIWLISVYEKNQRIQFVRINAIRSIKYDLTITPNNEHTDILWQQEISALNSDGNHFIDSVKQANFNQQIEMLGILMNYYLKTGNKMVRE